MSGTWRQAGARRTSIGWWWATCPLYATLQRAQSHPAGEFREGDAAGRHEHGFRNSEEADAAGHHDHAFGRRFLTVGLLQAAFLALMNHGLMEDAYRMVYHALMNGHVNARWLASDVVPRPPLTVTRRSVSLAVLAMCFSVSQGRLVQRS